MASEPSSSEDIVLETGLPQSDFDIALQEVCQKYPELSQQISRSLETPQINKHHQEGPTMKSHLEIMLGTLDDVRNGVFHPAIQDPQLQGVISRVCMHTDSETGEKSVNPLLIDYIFLHDISKPDCLTLRIEDEKDGIEITWEQWKEIQARGKPNPFRGGKISSISYFHRSEGALGQHGNKAVELLKGTNVSPEIITAIGKHEVAYQFQAINTKTYQKHFIESGFTQEQQDLILVASYIDTMGSIAENGEPDLTNFLNLVASRSNYLLIESYLNTGTKVKQNELNALMKENRRLTIQDLESIILH